MVQQTIPARKGKATKLSKGECIKVINTYGTQVIDTWAFNVADLQVTWTPYLNRRKQPHCTKFLLLRSDFAESSDAQYDTRLWVA